MNATSKGVKLEIFEEGRGKGMEAAEGGGQPYVDFMGRRCVPSYIVVDGHVLTRAHTECESHCARRCATLT